MGEWSSVGTVLVVDDNEGVRDLVEDTLVRVGFDVLCAADGGEGVELFAKHADRIRAVLLDRTMPITSGEEAFDQLRRIRPDAAIILVSGYSEERAVAEFAGKGLAGFLQKPFLPAALVGRLRSVLGE